MTTINKKFRLWNDALKQWVNPCILRIDNAGNMYYQRDNVHIASQFTGILDKSGDDIFEGDIVKRPNEDEPLGIVKWIDAYSGHRIVSKYNDLMFFLNTNGPIRADLLVIGNIYENPELLKDNY